MKLLYFIVFICSFFQGFSSYVLLPMDAESQKNHLKAYGITYWTLQQNKEVKWLLNYRGGAFLLPFSENLVKECSIRGVSYELLSNTSAAAILKSISSPSSNMDAIILEKAPKIAVYTPSGKQPWDDAVTLVLSYAEIPYEVIYDEEVLSDILPLFDWLHLHMRTLQVNMVNFTLHTKTLLGIKSKKYYTNKTQQNLVLIKYQTKN